MSTGKETHIREGKLIDAMRASISLPGILPPAKINDDLFLDGGIVNPTPVDVVKNMGADIVIGVDLTMNQPVRIENPSIVDTLMRSFEILRTRTTELNIGKIDDNTIIIKTNKAKIVDTYRFYDHKFITEGEKTAKKYLPKIKEAIRNWEEKRGDNDEI
jgi:NTE family protein